MVGKGNQKSPAAVAGMQIDYGKFRQMFFDQTKGKCGTNGDLACYVRTHHIFSPILNLLWEIFFSIRIYTYFVTKIVLAYYEKKLF